MQAAPASPTRARRSVQRASLAAPFLATAQLTDDLRQQVAHATLADAHAWDCAGCRPARHGFDAHAQVLRHFGSIEQAPGRVLLIICGSHIPADLGFLTRNLHYTPDNIDLNAPNEAENGSP